MSPESQLAVSEHLTTEFDEVLRSGVRCVYQPFVDLDTGSIVAHEALLRGPAGTPWESPMVLLAAAAGAHRVSDLERQSLRRSLTDAATQSRGRPMTLFVNLEPSTLTGSPDVVIDALAHCPSNVQVVVEITERALAADVAGVLSGAEKLRAAGCAIALDDVGVEPESLAFIPLLRPEIVKLDLGLLRSVSDLATVSVAGAVRAYAEATGAEVVAEGIETPRDLTRALVLGATLGQGWLWGRPDGTLAPAIYVPERFQSSPVTPLLRATPFELIERSRWTRRAPKQLLMPLSRSMEAVALAARVPPLLLAGFEDARFFTPATAARYTTLAQRLPFVCALGKGMPAAPAPGVRGQALSDDDPLAREWTVVVLAAHESAALIARDLGDEGPDGDRQFEFVVTYDRATVTAAAQSLVGRLVS